MTSFAYLGVSEAFLIDDFILISNNYFLDVHERFEVCFLSRK